METRFDVDAFEGSHPYGKKGAHSVQTMRTQSVSYKEEAVLGLRLRRLCGITEPLLE
jgi:hypothetical protein